MFIKEKSAYKLVDTDSIEVVKRLEPGVYNMKVRKNMFSKDIMFEHNDKYKKGMNITTGIFKEIKQYIDDFFSVEMHTVREEMQMNNKLGLLFKGLPGTGKTYLAGQLAERYAQEKNAIGIMTTASDEVDLGDVIKYIRLTDSDPDRLIVFIMDELEKKRISNDSAFLSFMDGADSKDNILIIATVNKTKDLPNTLLQRPGRFERIFDFKSEKDEVIKNIVTDIIPTQYHNRIDLDIFVKGLISSNKTTIDYIRIEVRNILTSILQNKDSNDKVAIKVAPNLMKEEADKNTIGFKAKYQEVTSEMLGELCEKMSTN